MITYSLDLRRKVLACLKKGNTQENIAQVFRITEWTIRNWLRQEKQGTIAPKSRKSGSYKIDEANLVKYIEDHPDACLREIADESVTTLQAIFYACKRLKITLKKRSRNAKNETKKLAKSVLPE